MSNEISTIEATTEVTENVENVMKHAITAQQKRQLDIMISDAANNINHSNPASEQAAYERLGRYTAMLHGSIPFEAPSNFKPMPPIRSKAGAKTYTVFFYAPTAYLRDAKICLRRSLGLLHDPHAMKVVGDPDVRRFRVNDLSREDATTVVSNNENLFHKFEVQDNAREDSGVMEPVQTAPKTSPLNDGLKVSQEFTEEEIAQLKIDDGEVEEAASETIEEEDNDNAETEQVEDDLDLSIEINEGDDLLDE